MSTREPADLLIEARWLLPIVPAAALADHAVAVSAGLISAVGPSAELRARFAPREHVVRERHALLPGLVNAYTRSAHALLRGLPVRGPRAHWLTHVVEPLEARCMSAAFVRDGTQLAMAAMLRAGITCFATHDLYPEEAAHAAAAAHMRAAIGLPVTDGASAWADGASAHLARAERLWDEYRSDARISLYFAPPAVHSLSDATLGRLRRVADELDARIALHLGELPADPAHAASEVRDADASRSHAAHLPALRRLDAQGLLRPGFTAIGAACDAADVELLDRRGACLIACPQADLRLGGGWAALTVLDADRTGLGTDSPAAAGAFDLLAEARAAALLGGLSAGSALRMATLGSATVLGLGGLIGSFDCGKAADLLCVDLEGAGCELGARPEEALLYGSTRAAVSDVWTAGRPAVRAGRLIAFEESELAAIAVRWAQRAGLEAAA
jgi:5-methylthioadenosine/S-adenosylhomocysteine deaminase